MTCPWLRSTMRGRNSRVSWVSATTLSWSISA